MAQNEELTNRVREALETVANVKEKKMFSGITFMVNGKMCVSVSSERIMVRIDPAIHNELIRRKGAETMVMKGREYIGWVNVFEDGTKTKKDLEYWVALALDFNKKAKATVKKKK